ncbi:PREDICTED: protein SPT2 homolog [Chrysochloris asiatica]|uniref:Protein SPT2 homolog n=1 Tax=Chrysochloris asiatica TaxID=185453 RepID=A0A9B0TIB0_CHRAS|nr:PREDICTED: protein SPT2 homolog [Chrysochloris asiatica]
MDFREILLMASKGQGVNNVPKRYSLAVGPPKKDPKVKGVQSAAVQAFLRRKEEELRRKTLEEKRRKEELVKKRIELKHDKKARAMAKRTKDNFHGYNGIPVEEKSKKKLVMENPTSQGTDQEYEMEDDDDFLEYNQAESDLEYEEEPEPPKVESKPKVHLKSAPPPMNFTDLLRLAEKKQYEPVEIKVVKKPEERPMTAEELREREFLERKHRKKKPETDARLPPAVSKKAPSQKESVGTKLNKVSGDKISSSKGTTSLPHAEKKSRPSTANEKHLGLLSSKPISGERTKAVTGNCSQPSLREGHDRPVFNGAGKPHSSTYSPSVPKTSVCGTVKSATEHKAKKPPSHPSHSRPGPTVSSSNKVKSPGVRQPGSGSSSTPGRSSTGIARPTDVFKRQNGSSSSGPERSISGTKRPASDSYPSGRTVSGASGPGRPMSGSGASGRPVGSSGSLGRPVSKPHDLRRPMSGSGPPRRSGSDSVSAGQTVRPVSSLGPRQTISSSGLPVKPRCTVVSETISSRNIISRSSNGQMNGMKPLLSGYRSAHGPPRLPFASGYKRHREYDEEDDEDYDSEMEDFIEDEGEPQEEISKHIREIFGYDRKKYKDESDYALRYMESSWKEQQKEEAKSLRLGMQEDLEEMRREEEEMKRQKNKKLKRR